MYFVKLGVCNETVLRVYYSTSVLFILQDLLQCYCYYCGVFIEKCVYTKFHPEWLLLQGRVCPYRNVWPVAVYCCLQELHCLLNCLSSELEVAITSPSFIALHLPVSEIAYCLRVFYKNYIVYHTLYCNHVFGEEHVYTTVISGLHAYICPHSNAWPEAVYCCFIRTTMFTMLFTC